MTTGETPPPAEVRLRPPSEFVSERARVFWAVRAGLVWAVLILAELVWWLAAPEPPGAHVGAGIATVVVAATHLTLMPIWRYRLHRWEASEQAVYTQRGWLRLERRIAPFSRVQTVDTTRGPFEQLFGLTTVTITTASAAGPLSIEGLSRDRAERLVRIVTAATAAERGDAT